MQEVWAEIGDIVVHPAMTDKGINADFLMLVAGSVLGALCHQLGGTAELANLAKIAIDTCRDTLGRNIEEFGGKLNDLPLDIASECVVRLMPDIEQAAPNPNEASIVLAAWIGTWAAKFDQYGVPAEEFIAQCFNFAQAACLVDNWTLRDASDAIVGSWPG